MCRKTMAPRSRRGADKRAWPLRRRRLSPGRAAPNQHAALELARPRCHQRPRARPAHLHKRHPPGRRRHRHRRNRPHLAIYAPISPRQPRRRPQHDQRPPRWLRQSPDSELTMRVLMTSDTIGGVWTYSLELARALQPYGIQYSLATMGQSPTDDQRAEAAAIPNLELHESTFKLEWMANPWNDVQRAGDWLLELEQQFQPDVVHLNGYAHAACAFHAPILVVGHSCVLSWWDAVKKGDSPPYFDTYRHHVAQGLARADIVIAPTQAMLNALERHYGALPRSQVIYNGRDPASFKSAHKEMIILTAGRLWDEAKNVAAVDEVAPRLPWPVFMAGESTHPVAGAMQQHNLRRLGQLSQFEMANWFARAMIYALPARYEPFGLTALEAALSGCALVLGEIESLREVWQDAAIFVPPNDLDALASALGQLCIKPALRNEMAAKAREQASRYTADRMASEYSQLYQQLQHASL